MNQSINVPINQSINQHLPFFTHEKNNVTGRRDRPEEQAQGKVRERGLPRRDRHALHLYSTYLHLRAPQLQPPRAILLRALGPGSPCHCARCARSRGVELFFFIIEVLCDGLCIMDVAYACFVSLLHLLRHVLYGMCVVCMCIVCVCV